MDLARVRVLNPLRMLCLIVLTLSLAGCALSDEVSTTTVTLSDEVAVQAPIRFGMNIGESTYYNDQQVVANPLTYGDFPKGRQTLQIRVGKSTGNTITDTYFDAADPDRSYSESFAGGTYYIATGSRTGETGEILAHDLESGTYTLEHEGAPLAENDVVWLKGPIASRGLPDAANQEPGLGIGDWRMVARDGVTVEFVDDPEEASDQLLRINFPPAGERLSGGTTHYIKATPGTTYRLRIRARSELQEASIGVRFSHLGMEGGGPDAEVRMNSRGDTILTPEWKEYVFEGTSAYVDEVASKFSSITIGVAVTTSATNAGPVYIDSISFEDETLASPTGFAKQVVEKLKEVKPGTLRFYGIQGMGTLVEGLTAENTADAPWNFLGYRSGFRFNGTGAVVDQWMLLCQETKADPWITVGGANTPDDYYRLVSYLAAPADFDEDSKRRGDHGYSAPWTEQFGRIYVEIGNEWWNPIFRPFYIWDPVKYGEMCKHIIARMRENPHFDDERLQIVVGGWAVNAHHWNTKLDAACEGHDIISLAPYLGYEMNEFASNEMRYGSLFAGVEAYRRGEGKQIIEELADNGKGTRLAVYEINTHITTGLVPGHVVSEIAPSVAAGVAVLDHTMAILEDMKAWPINYFNLLQRRYGFGENVREGMWGNLIRTDKGELRPRPIWEAMRLANEYLIAGDMVRVDVDGSPSWDFPGNGNVPELDDVPYIHAYAFRTKDGSGAKQYNVLLINRHLDETQPVEIHLPFMPKNPVKRITLTGDHLYDNNEQELKVTLQESEEEGVSEASRYLVPPFSAVVYQFVDAG